MNSSLSILDWIWTVIYSSIFHSLPDNPTFNDLEEETFENIVGKGESAGNQHFLFFRQCFLPYLKQILIFQSHASCRLQMLSIWTSLKISRLLTFPQTSPGF